MTGVSLGAVTRKRGAVSRVFLSNNLDVFLAAPKPRCQQFADFVRISPQRAFPNNSNPPAGIRQCLDGCGVPALVVLKLGIPEIGAGFRKPRVVAAHMAMPEAAMYEYNRIPLGQDQVRLPSKALGMQSVSEAIRPEVSANLHFRDGVLPPDT